MRIALTIHALFGGGAERLMSQLAARWAEAGHELHLITWAERSSDRYSLPSTVQRHGLGLLQPSRNRWQGLWANYHRVQVLRSTLNEIQPEFILSFCDQMNIVTLQAARKMPIPVWVAEHSDPSKQRLSAFWEFWRRRTYPRCSGCIVLTPAIGDYLSRWIARERIVVLPNAIDGPPLPGQRRDQSPDQSLDPPSRAQDVPQGRTGNSPPVVLALGRLSREKGVDLLLDAWRQTQGQLPGWQLHIVGDGAQRRALEEQSQGLEGVRFLGWLDEPWPAYRTASLFVLPSRYEGFPVALVEAMSQGLPCITTRCSQAVDELSREGTALERVATESPAAIAAALLALAADPQRRAQLAATAQRVSQEYTWQRIGPRWDRLLSGEEVAADKKLLDASLDGL